MTQIFSKATPGPPPPDPAIAQQQEQARQNRITSMQQSLSDDTFGILRMFGQSRAAQTAGIAAPFSSTSGGFTTPFGSPSGVFAAKT